MSALDPSAVDPAAFIAQVRQASDDDLKTLMSSEYRPLVIDGITEQMAARVRPDATDAVIHWKVLDRPGGGYDHVEIVLHGGKGERSAEATREPDVTFKVGPVDFLRLVTGTANGPMMFMTGRLKIDGNLMLAARVQGFFEVPEG